MVFKEKSTISKMVWSMHCRKPCKMDKDCHKGTRCSCMKNDFCNPIELDTKEIVFEKGFCLRDLGENCDDHSQCILGGECFKRVCKKTVKSKVSS